MAIAVCMDISVASAVFCVGIALVRWHESRRWYNARRNAGQGTLWVRR
jgi:hypothetical protein